MDQINLLEKTKLESNIDCILGDTNFWCFSKKQFFFFKNDKVAYNKLTKHYTDTTIEVGGTVKMFGLNFDKIFVSNKLKYDNVTCIRKNGKFMDHYPVFLDLCFE